MIRAIDIRCTSCEVLEERFIDYPAEWDMEHTCTSCNAPSIRTISVPSIRTSESRTFRDGADRGSDFNKMKEAAKLKVIASDLPHNQRGQIKQEIRKLGAGTDDL